MLDDLTPLISNLGFPIVVALYLLIRVEKKIEVVEQKIEEVTKTISKLL